MFPLLFLCVLFICLIALFLAGVPLCASVCLSASSCIFSSPPFFPPSDAAVLVSSVWCERLTGGHFFDVLPSRRRSPRASGFEDCQVVFFSTFLCFVDTREAEEEDLFDQAPATPYLHTQVYRRLALAAVGGVGRGSRRCSRPDYLSA